MLRFEVYRDGKPADDIDLAGAYLFGQDGIPVRADIAFADGVIHCRKHAPGPCGLAVVWDAGKVGRFLIPTTRLPERGRPYNLNLELARAQMMQTARKREDWGLFDYRDAGQLNKQYRAVGRKFIEAIKCHDPAEAAKLADRVVADGMILNEKIALFHADIFLAHRKTGTGAERFNFGCGIDINGEGQAYARRLNDAFDFLSIPSEWKKTEPKERLNEYTLTDKWVNWAAKIKKPVHFGPLVSFAPQDLPQWLYIWEHDREALRDLVYEHIQRLVNRYKQKVSVWKVLCGIHAQNEFNFNFEQLLELTRMSCLLVKKIDHDADALIEIIMPWGEYYARNQRTIPPLLYADMAVQSGVKFDGFGLQLRMGAPRDGYFLRDLMQISSLIDEFMSFGKPLHITACQAPSGASGGGADTNGRRKGVAPSAGRWHAPWSERLQAEWLQALCRIAISKPHVQSICWADLDDADDMLISGGGLCRKDLSPKMAYRELRNFRAQFLSGNVSTTPISAANGKT